MAHLALKGGKPLYKGPWPTWPIASEPEKNILSRVIDSNKWSYNGDMEKTFNKEWSDFTGANYSFLVSNGTVALQLALEALGIGFGDEVIVPGLTWQADAEVVINVNAVPILVDIEEDSWCIDPKKVENALTPRTKAIIAVHLFGTICDIEKLKRIANSKGLFLIEDCSHQHGSVFKDRHVGTFGDIGTFSLQNTKVLTCGEGGIIVTNNSETAVKLDALRNCGRKPESISSDKNEGYSNEGDLIQSGNYRITEFQAAILLEQFKRFTEQVRIRDRNAAYLNRELTLIEGIKPMLRRTGTTVQSYYQFAFRYDRKYFRNVSAALFRKALASEIAFEFDSPYKPLNDWGLYRPLTKKRHYLNKEYMKLIDPSRFRLPVCSKVYYESGITAHHSLLLGTKEQCSLVIEAVKKIKKNSNELLE